MNRAEDVLPWQSGKIPLQIKNAELKIHFKSFFFCAKIMGELTITQKVQLGDSLGPFKTVPKI